MRKTCLDMVYELARQDERVVFIGSDLGVGTLNNFKRDFPDRFYMEGVSEAFITGMAAGLALEGKIVYFNTIATFLTRRNCEQVILDLCLHRVPVRLIGSGGGLVYAPLGPTHLATDDFALLRALPNMAIVAVADAEEMRRMMPCTLDYPGPMYIRLGKGGDPVATRPEMGFSLGQVYPMQHGAAGALISTGIMLPCALEAAKLLAADGLPVTVLHVPTVKPLTPEALLPHLAAAPVVVSIEEHSLIGGLGSAVAEILAEAPDLGHKRFKRLALPDRFPEKYGSQASLLAHYGLTPPNLAATFRRLAGR